MIMQHWSIFGTACSPPEPDQVVEALRQAGFPAARIAEARASPGISTSFALHYDPQRAPLFVGVEWLVPEERDVNTGTWEMAEELIGDPLTLQSIRCYADLRHYENADSGAVEAAVDFLQAACGALGLFLWQMH